MSGWQWNGLVQTRVTGSSTRKAVLMLLAEAANERGESFRGIDNMARIIEVSGRTVRRTLVDFEAEGLVTRERRRRRDGTLGVYDYTLRWEAIASLPWNGVKRKGHDGDPFASSTGHQVATGAAQPPDTDDTSSGHLVSGSPADIWCPRVTPVPEPQTEPPLLLVGEQSVREEEEVAVKEASDSDPFVAQEGQGRDKGQDDAPSVWEAQMCREAVADTPRYELPTWYRAKELTVDDLTAYQARMLLRYLNAPSTPEEYAELMESANEATARAS